MGVAGAGSQPTQVPQDVGPQSQPPPSTPPAGQAGDGSDAAAVGLMDDIGGELMNQAGENLDASQQALKQSAQANALARNSGLVNMALAQRGETAEKGDKQTSDAREAARNANQQAFDAGQDRARDSGLTSAQQHSAARNLASLEGGKYKAEVQAQQSQATQNLANLSGKNLPSNINSSAAAEQFVQDMAKHNEAADARRADQAASKMDGKLAQRGLPPMSADARAKLTRMLKLQQQMARLKQAQRQAKLMGEKGKALEKALGDEMAKIESELQEAQEALPDEIPPDLAEEAGDEVENERRAEDGDDAGETGDKKSESKTVTKEAVKQTESGEGESSQGDTADAQTEQLPVQVEAVPLQESFARLQPVFSSGAEGTGAAQGSEGELDAHANVVALGVICGGRAMVDPQSGEIRRVKGLMERGRNPSDSEDFGHLADPEGHAKEDGLGLGTGIRPGARNLTRGGNIYATNTWQIRRALDAQGGDRVMLPNGQSISRNAAMAEIRQDDIARLAMVRGMEVNPGSWYHNSAGFA